MPKNKELPELPSPVVAILRLPIDAGSVLQIADVLAPIYGEALRITERSGALLILRPTAATEPTDAAS